MLIWLHKELLVKICFIVIFFLIEYSFYISLIKLSTYGKLCTLENRTCSTFKHHYFEHLCQLFWKLTYGVLNLNILILNMFYVFKKYYMAVERVDVLRFWTFEHVKSLNTSVKVSSIKCSKMKHKGIKKLMNTSVNIWNTILRSKSVTKKRSSSVLFINT